MLTYEQARSKCALSEHTHLTEDWATNVYGGELKAGEEDFITPIPEWKQGNSQCMWKKAMDEFKTRTPQLENLVEDGKLAYVYGNGFVLPLAGGAVWHADFEIGD